jgi:cytidyltransferase-like protein
LSGHARILATGVFDLFHIGHLRYLQHARAQGTSLIVGVLDDELVWRLKAKRPAIPLAQRMELIAGLACVNEVRVQPSSTRDVQAASQWIPGWGASHVVVGGMWQGDSTWTQLETLLQPQGITVSYAPATPDISSTGIAERLRGGGK